MCMVVEQQVKPELWCGNVAGQTGRQEVSGRHALGSVEGYLREQVVTHDSVLLEHNMSCNVLCIDMSM